MSRIKEALRSNARQFKEAQFESEVEQLSAELPPPSDLQQHILDYALSTPTITYLNGKVNTINYADSKTKSFNYTGDLLTSIVFNNGVETKTKTLNYTNGVLTSITES